jgi:hypothetical protein
MTASTLSAALQVDVLSVGLVGPGLPSWTASKPVLAGHASHAYAPTVVAAPARLPATERRRAGVIIKVSINVADEALNASGLQAREVATVFSASEGDGKNCHDLCEALALPDRVVSPTRFTNSVHNAAAGYWHIATQSMAPSTSLCAFDASFAQGLMEAALQACDLQAPVMLVVADQPYPEPLHATRSLGDAMGVALVLAPVTQAASTASALRLALRWQAHSHSHAHDAATALTPCGDPSLERLRAHLPAARSLPLLSRLAGAPPTPTGLMLDGGNGLGLHVA